MLDRLRLHVGMRLCRVLPPSLAYRLDFALLSDLYSKPIEFEARALFGRSTLRGVMNRMADAEFALHGTCNYLGLAVVRTLCGPGDTIVEVGANIGTETLSLADVVGASGSVVAIEPLPGNLALLRERCDANGLSQVHIVAAAIAADAGEVHMQPTRHHAWTFASETGSQGSVAVPSVTLDQLCAERSAPAFIWMDIEGYELKALRGAAGVLGEARPVVYTEVDSEHLARAGDDIGELLEFVHDSDYLALDAQPRAAPLVTSTAALPRKYHSDWLLLPRERAPQMAPRLRRVLRRSRFMPQVGALSPLG